MKIDLFDFDLPEELIAQTPLPNRDASRLMVLDKKPAKSTMKLFATFYRICVKGIASF